MKSSKLTTKFQTSVPEEVRKLLHLAAGDRVLWEIENGKVVIKKATPLDLEFLRGLEMTLGEWSSENDEVAYRDL